ncbi:MAG TPA: DEAD/DEAH box helicase [Chloroflexota bacterium]|nr:DEAD/DEAH box helicase [Chloroflexota bacterium]
MAVARSAEHTPFPDLFHPAVTAWLAETFAAPTRAQAEGWPEIVAGRATLILAPTGSGKTLAAFLAVIDRVMFSPVPAKQARCRVLYVSPLRALAFDVERNLRAPLVGIARVAERRGDAVHLPTVALRTGDTEAGERARMLRNPPDILITTPESLYLMLTSQARSILQSVELVIVDEIHTLAGTKRGAHLALSLERLGHLAGRPIQRVGLSATQRPLDEVARYLGGGEEAPRPVSVVDAGVRKAFDLRVEVPVEDMSRLGEVLRPDQGEIPEGATSVLQRHSIWPAIYPRLLSLIQAHRSTIVFVNSRRLAERVAGALNELAGEEIAQAHHGSIAREQRVVIEDRLKAGTLPAMVATSSLELGIDMGAVDLVVQIETPQSVASGLQRIGRAGHQVEGVSRGVIFPKYRGDLLSTAAITQAMDEGRVEKTRVPRNPLDVLTQQIVAICAVGEWRVDELERLVRQATPFATLTRGQLEGVLDMLSGRYPADDLAELRPRITWDRLKGTVRAREGLQRLVVANAGTIPDRGLYGVFLADGAAEPALGSGEAGGASDGPGASEAALPPRRGRSGRRVGELDEEMVFESRQGDVVVLGASSWRVVEITRDRVLVEPAPGEPGRMPFWRGDRASRPVELGEAIGRLTRELIAMSKPEARSTLIERHSLEPGAAENLLAYLDDQRSAIDAVPDDRTVVIERTRDELGDWRLCLLSPWGGRVHAPWALALQAKLRASDDPIASPGSGLEAETIWSDDGIVVRLPDRGTIPDTSLLLPDPDEVEDLVVRELGGSALFAAHFREAAGRALLIPRHRPGQRAPLWMQRKRAADLLAVASRYGSFPIVLETFRECLQDVFDMPALVELARRLRRRELRVVTVDAEAPSPFAASLLFGYVANYIYDGDAPLAERRAQALAVDQAQLRELLGAAELRELLDAQVLESLELSLQGLDAGHKARSPDRLHDLLLRLGDLTLDEIAARVDPPPTAFAAAWLAELEAERRVIRLQLGGEERFAAVEDAGRLRDAFGAPPPLGLPAAFLEPVPTALQDVVARYARTHAPFRAADVARRYGAGEAPVLAALRTLVERGRVLEGEFRPGGSGREWCDADVLANARRRSLAKLRKQVEPAEPAALGRLLVEWQDIATTTSTRAQIGGPDRLLDVIEQLQGAAMPASVLETDILPARLPRYRPRDLDLLCAAGEVVLVGAGPLGERDGRIALYLTDDLPLLKVSQPDPPDGDYHQRLRVHLERYGASFFAELQQAAGGPAGMVLDALWDLVWAGEVTNDSPAALRAYLSGAAAVRALGRRRSGPFRSRRQAPPSAVGRWSLVGTGAMNRAPTGEVPVGAQFIAPASVAPASVAPAGGGVTSTERARAVAEQLVARHGILTRQAVLAEGVPGGFAALYPVLASLEEAGRLRRGYFLAGLGGAQFAQAGAVDRLRALRESAVLDDPDHLPAVVLAATDPANPYGAALPWPLPAVASAPKPMRSAGARVILVDGMLAAFVRGDRDVATFLPAEEPARSAVGRAAATAAARWAVATGRVHLGWATVDGVPAARSAFGDYLSAAGFSGLGAGFRLVSSAPDAPDDDLGEAVPPLRRGG